MPRATVLLAAAIMAAYAKPAAAATFALLVGISHYQKLPRDLWLQYPDADAVTFSKFLSSPRGGGVPPGRILMLTNEQATTARVRNAFHTFLTGRPAKDDTVYILMAGHGSVDARGAYILTYDTDPENLAATALPMAELRRAVEEELTRVARVILLADVCRAAAIAGQKTDSLAGAVQEMGEAPGELLGLMAARPAELSLEGPEFGGGHGAFTYSILKGLGGAADLDHDGFVTAGELIDFVSSDVSERTRNRQHPRDFGNMENATRLSDLSKPGIAIQ